MGLHRTASLAEVKKTYRTLAKQYHPDYNKTDPNARDKFQAITAAYDVIVDGKYNPDNYGPVQQQHPTPSLHNRFHLTTEMSNSFTGITLNGLPFGAMFLKPGFIAGETWTLTKNNITIYLEIHYHPNKDFSHKRHDLYTIMTTTKKAVKQRTRFTLTNHPNPNAAKVLLPKNVKNGDSVLVQGEGLPNSKGGFGDLHIKVIFSDVSLRSRIWKYRFIIVLLIMYIWLSLIFFK